MIIDRIFELGRVDFEEALSFQCEVFEKVSNREFSSALILCQPDPVITFGSSADKNNILVSAAKLSSLGIKIHKVDRGGDVTYHGPGQLLAYPVLDLNYFKKDIHWFLARLEQVIVKFLEEFGILAEARSGFRGVWLKGQKIASIGIGVRRWITYHGFSVNVSKRALGSFSLIRPCGMDIMMTSMESVLGREVSFDEAGAVLIRRFKND